MASTFAEMFSDFQDNVKIYTEKLDITEMQFLRLLTKGMQKFQRQTEYIENVMRITPDPVTTAYMIPNGLLRLIEVKDKDFYSVLMQSPEQFIRIVEKWQDGYLETPTDWQIRKQGYLRNNNPTPQYTRTSGVNEYQFGRICTIIARELRVQPIASTDTYFDLYYIPDLDPFSINSTQWNTGDPLTSWFPEDTNFYTRFSTASINPAISMWEDTFVSYATAEYIKSRGSRNYQVFEAQYKADVELAKLEKPVLFREAVSDYMMSPYS